EAGVERSAADRPEPARELLPGAGRGEARDRGAQLRAGRGELAQAQADPPPRRLAPDPGSCRVADVRRRRGDRPRRDEDGVARGRVGTYARRLAADLAAADEAHRAAVA